MCSFNRIHPVYTLGSFNLAYSISSSVREEILFALTSPLRYPEVYQKSAKGRGVLLYGPPGTGKTLVAKVSYIQYRSLSIHSSRYTFN